MTLYIAQEGLEKSSALQYSHHTSPLDVINFISVCSGLDPIIVNSYGLQIRGPVGQVHVRTARIRKLQNTILDIDDAMDMKSDPCSTTLRSAGGNRNIGLQTQVIGFLDQQSSYMHEKWQSISRHKQGISGTLLHNMVGFILTACYLCPNMAGCSHDLSRKLEKKLRDIIEDLIRYLESDECNQKQMDGLLLAVYSFLPKVSDIIDPSRAFLSNLRGNVGIFITKVSNALLIKVNAADSLQHSNSPDEMDIDDEFGFNDIRGDEEKDNARFLREDVETLCSEEAFRASTTALLSLCALSLTDCELIDKCSQFSNYLINTSKSRLMMMRLILRDFVSAACDTLHNEDSKNLCEYIAIELLQGYEVERCEISMLVCIDVIAALATKWVNGDQNVELTDTCGTVYEYAIKSSLDKRVTSYSVRNAITSLLLRIIRINSSYRKEDKNPPLQLITTVLQDGDVRVIFFLAQQLHNLFEIFGETFHLKLCQDIEAALPSQSDWTEGLIMRVYALGDVALSSLSNISRIIYRIFETGQLAVVEKHAARALLKVAKASGLNTQRDLFKLFCSKLIFTWTDHYDLKNFPHLVFGYESLAEMFKDISEELIAQLMAKSKDDGAKFVSRSLGTSLDRLLISGFPKVIAYGIAWAVGMASPKDLPPQKPVTFRVQKILGQDTFNNLFNDNFVLIIANLYLLVHDDGGSEKLLSKDPSLSEVVRHLEDIKAEGHTQRKLPLLLNPMFRSKVILNAIHHACKIGGINDLDVWTPSVVTLVARKLFDGLHPAQGPIHTCSVIRNIRLLVCLAGPKAHEGYPLQMLIQGLKPYVVDSACAEDTVGILRYLLVKGNFYLSSQPSFVVETFLSILALLREYMQSSQNLLGEDTDTCSTGETVRSFYTWLSEHLAKLRFPNLNAKQNQTFQSIVESAVGFQHNGNALKETKESQLLLHLLDDDMSEEKLLDDSSRQLAFSIFCSSFTRPTSFRNDVFGSDHESFERSKSLLRICKQTDVNNKFMLWSARVLGRSFASTGQLHIEWTQEMGFSHSTKSRFRDSQIDIVPKINILQRLKTILFSDNQAVVGLAEMALTRIIHYEMLAGVNTVVHVLSPEEFRALQLSVTPTDEKLPIQPISSCEKPDFCPASVWIKNLTIALCSNLSEVPIIKGINLVLEQVDGLAEELFPYIAHILLVRELKKRTGLRDKLSNLFQACFASCSVGTVSHNSVLIKTILYLRSQRVEKETTHSVRDYWLEINYLTAARAACKCKMYKTALLFAEIHSSQTLEEPADLYLEIFNNIDDLDSFYGVSQIFSLRTVMDSFEHEGNGWSSLLFRGANLESGIRLSTASEDDSVGIVDALNTLGMNGLSHSVIQSNNISSNISSRTIDNRYRSAWKLEQWDLPCSSNCDTRSAPIYRALRSVNNTADSLLVSSHMDPEFLSVMKQITAGTQTGHTLGGAMRTLAMLTEMEEVLLSTSSIELDGAWERLQTRNTWMETGR
jgi:ataxia telangiectasia mutated family protein